MAQPDNSLPNFIIANAIILMAACALYFASNRLSSWLSEPFVAANKINKIPLTQATAQDMFRQRRLLRTGRSRVVGTVVAAGGVVGTLALARIFVFIVR